jgi:archaellum component FlaC
MDKANNDDNDMSHYEGALLEEINDRLKGIQEGQDSLAHVPKQLDAIDNRLRAVESDVKVIKAAVTEHSRDIKDLKSLEPRLAKLEAAHA